MGSGSDARSGDAPRGCTSAAAAAAAPWRARSVTSARSFASRARNARSSAVRRSASRCSNDKAGPRGERRVSFVSFSFVCRLAVGSGWIAGDASGERAARSAEEDDGSTLPRAAARRKRAPRRESRQGAVASSTRSLRSRRVASAVSRSSAADAQFASLAVAGLSSAESGANNARRRGAVVALGSALGIRSAVGDALVRSIAEPCAAERSERSGDDRASFPGSAKATPPLGRGRDADGIGVAGGSFGWVSNGEAEASGGEKARERDSLRRV